MCQVHTGAYVSLLARGKTDYTGCHPRKTTTYILHVLIVPITTLYAYTPQTQVNWKKETKRLEERGEGRTRKKRSEKGTERKEQTKEARKRQGEKRKQGKEKRKNVILADHGTN